MKKFAVLFFLLHLICYSYAFADLEYIFLEKNSSGVTEVIFRNQNSEITLGELQTLPKGTRLYHWEKASASQIKKWNSEGKISEERLNALKKLGGNSGGGFYASLSPLDSINYGNTAIVIELPKDTFSLHLTTNNGFFWNAILPELQRKGISIVSVRHTPTWLNVIDPETLSKIHVATAKDFEGLKIETIERPWSYKKFFKLFPELENHEYLKKSFEKMEVVYKAIKVPSDEGRAAVAAIMESGSSDLAKEVFKKASVGNFTKESIKAALARKFFYYGPLFEKLSLDSEKYSYVLIEGLKNGSTEAVASNSMRSTPMDVYERTRILQTVMEFQGETPSYYVDTLVKEYKSQPGQWLPHPLCKQIFN